MTPFSVRATKAIVGGWWLGIVLSVGFHGSEKYLLKDRDTWHYFAAGIAADIITATAASAITWGATQGVALFFGTTTGAVPMIVVVVVGWLLTRYGEQLFHTSVIKAKLAESLVELEDSAVETLHLNCFFKNPVDYLYRAFQIETVKIPQGIQRF